MYDSLRFRIEGDYAYPALYRISHAKDCRISFAQPAEVVEYRQYIGETWEPCRVLEVGMTHYRLEWYRSQVPGLYWQYKLLNLSSNIPRLWVKESELRKPRWAPDVELELARIADREAYLDSQKPELTLVVA